jgi:hypothetical protein
MNLLSLPRKDELFLVDDVMVLANTARSSL